MDKSEKGKKSKYIFYEVIIMNLKVLIGMTTIGFLSGKTVGMYYQNRLTDEKEKNKKELKYYQEKFEDLKGQIDASVESSKKDKEQNEALIKELQQHSYDMLKDYNKLCQENDSLKEENKALKKKTIDFKKYEEGQILVEGQKNEMQAKLEAQEQIIRKQKESIYELTRKLTTTQHIEQEKKKNNVKNTANKKNSKKDIVKKWRKKYPNGSRIECAKETGTAYSTVKKWWDVV